MIDQTCLTPGWIAEQGKSLGCSNPILLEKAIVALQLVGHLVEAGLPFQFKGGTSLLLVVSPSVDQLLGDKFTAFAPKTIGILEHPERAGDVVKQLFDVGVLFDVATNIDVAAQVYTVLHENQCRYRNAAYTVEQTLNDTIDSCLGLTWCDMKGKGKNNPIGTFLNDGVQRLQSHIVNGRFDRDPSRVAAGKAACAAALILRQPQIALESVRYTDASMEELVQAEITGDWAPLQKLRGGNPEAFFYWWKAQSILGQR